ncbi:MAG: hypothetical protein QOJ97_2775 [Solirubrobacteraceae bacterium]|jgi:glycosyltransferase involved in cell wall biosynthesis|nr:hypothetical protein [Solirubrobacteraceae bacterium]
MTGRERPLRVLVLTETAAVGGCDRFLADLACQLDPERVDLRFAGNLHPELDEYLTGRIPGFAGRDIVDLANMREPLLGRVALRLGVSRRARDEALSRVSSMPDMESRSYTLARLEDTVATAQRIAQDAINLRRLRAVIRRHQPDVVHANNGGFPGAEAVRITPLAARAEGVPSIQFVHNMAFPAAWPQPLERAIDARVDQAVDGWVTAAHRASDAFATARGIARDRVATIHYGVPLPPEPDPDPHARVQLGFPPDATGVLVVAAFEPRKGHAVLVDAVARLARAGTHLHVALVGTGPERERVETHVRKAGLASRVRFLGWRTDVDRLMAASDMVCLPSLSHECLPYAILEAMSHGRPIVSTDVAGIPEMVVDGQTGLVVAPGDPAALAAALAQLARDTAERARQGAAGRDRIAAQFHVRTMAAAVEERWRAAARNGCG